MITMQRIKSLWTNPRNRRRVMSLADLAVGATAYEITRGGRRKMLTQLVRPVTNRVIQAIR